MIWGSLALWLRWVALSVALLVFVASAVEGFVPSSPMISNTAILNCWKSTKTLRSTSEVVEGTRIANSDAGREIEFNEVCLMVWSLGYL